MSAPVHSAPAVVPPVCPIIEFWFDFASNYSYLSIMRIQTEAARRGVRIVWRPFLLGPIFGAQGLTELQVQAFAFRWRRSGVPLTDGTSLGGVAPGIDPQGLTRA